MLSTFAINFVAPMAFYIGSDLKTAWKWKKLFPDMA